ncbi:MAG: tetratricopeptide repeat protein [Pseudobacteriovorax sp.]|nr:tetratricopeptide repeat protein [Pseudobacteriovorax sp.]
MIKQIFSLVLPIVLVSCQTAPKNPFSSSDKLNLKSKGEASPELWSPEQRRANAGYYFMKAEDSALKGARKQALNFYEKAYNLEPNSFLAAKLISTQAYFEPQKAFQLCRKMVLLYPQDIHLNTLYGRLFLMSGEFKKAEKQFKRVLELDNLQIPGYIGLIQANRALDRVETAITVAKAMLQIDGSYAEGWAMLAKLYLSKKRWKLARSAAKKSYDMFSNHPEFIHLYALTLELTGDSKAAVALYETIFRLHPNNDDLIRRMVALYKQIGSLEEALSLLEEVKENSLKKNLFGIDLQIVFINWELKRFRKAAQLLFDMHRTYPKNTRVTYLAGLGHEKIGNFAQALQFYSNIPIQSKYYIHGQFRIALVLRKQKDYKAAELVLLKELKRGIEEEGDFSMLLAQVYNDQNLYQKAIKTLESALSKFEDRHDVRFLLGITQEKAGDDDESMETMKDIIKRDPNHSGALNYLAYTYAEAGENLLEAEKLVKRALEIKPGDGYYLDTLGWIYYKGEQLQKAVKVLREAVVAVPNESVILEHLADALKAIGKTAEARTYYEKAAGGRGSESDRARAKKKFLEMGTEEA